jgi:DNA-binding MarR family transcriptional regulator
LRVFVGGRKKPLDRRLPPLDFGLVRQFPIFGGRRSAETSGIRLPENGGMSEVSNVSSEEWDAWRAFAAMRKHLDLALERRLQRDAGISLPDFEILLALFESRDNQLRVGELSALLGWERTRLSHQVTRMENRGLVIRVERETDARGRWIAATAEGRRVILGAMRDHARGIREYFFDVMSREELGLVSDVSTRVLGAIDPPPCDDIDPEDSTGREATDSRDHDFAV